MRNHFLKGIAALVMGYAMTACTQDFNYEQQEQQASLDNAQQTLGFYIPENQDWVMSGMITANIPVNIKDGEVYTVKVYSNDPLTDGVGYVLATETVSNGQNFSATFRAPSYKHAYYFGLTNSEGETIYRSAYIEDGELKEFVEDKEIVYEEETNAARTRTITVNGDTYSAFTAPTSSEIAAAFPTSIPSTALEVADLTGDLYFVYKDNNTGRNYKVTKPGEITIGGSWNNDYDKSKANNVYVYVDGNVTIRRNGTEFMNLYILKGNVTLDSSFGECGGLVSVAEGATLNDGRAHIAHNGGINLYNKGTVNAINASGYDIGNNAAVYNEGAFAVTGPLSYSAGAGNTSYFMNMGDGCELTAPSMTMNSTCHFYTDGTVNISGETKVTQAGIVWINNGHYTTRTMVFSAHNGTFYNYCQLIVTEQCNFTDGLFNMMQNSYAELNTAVFNNFRVNMANNSGFNVKNGSKWGRQGADFIGQNQMQGFVASDDNAKCFVRLGGETQVPAYTGYAFNVQGANLTLAYNSIKFYKGFNNIDMYSSFSGVSYWNETTAEQLAANQDGDKTWNTHNVTKFVTGDDFANVKVETKSGQCAATWTMPGGSTIIEENQTWTYAFEDNKTRCDFDLNDVVIQVRESETDASKLIVTLVAAGCEYDNYVWLGDNMIQWANGAEVHAALNQAHGVMINTGNGKGVDTTPVSVTIDKPSGFDFQSADFKIRPYRIGSDPNEESGAVDGYITIQKAGVETGLWGPLGLAIPGKWKWPKERFTVNYAYPTFTSWGKEADLTLRPGLSGWYENPESGLVYGE